MRETAVEGDIGAAVRAHGRHRRLDNLAHCVIQGHVPQTAPVRGADHDGNPAAGLGDADHLRQHFLGVAFLHHRMAHHHVEAVVVKGQILGIAVTKGDDVVQPLHLGQGRGLAQKIAVHVHRADRIGALCAPGQPAVQGAGAAAHVQNGLARFDLYLVNMAAHRAHIAWVPAPAVNERDAAQVSAAQGDHAIVFRQSIDNGFPLRRRQQHGQQNQGRATAPGTVGNAGNFALGIVRLQDGCRFTVIRAF